MRATDFLGGRFLKQEHIPGPTLVSISSVFQEVVNEGERSKLCLKFEELDRDMVLNDTNLRACIESCGSDEVEAWSGKKIVVYVDPNVMFQGRRVGGLRIRAPVEKEIELGEAAGF